MIRRAIFITSLALLLAVPAFGMSNEPEGFRGIKWGSSEENLSSDFVFAFSSIPGNNFYIKKGDKKRIGDAEIESLYYSFYKKRFSQVVITVKGRTNIDALIFVFIENFGSPNPKYDLNTKTYRGLFLFLIYLLWMRRLMT